MILKVISEFIDKGTLKSFPQEGSAYYFEQDSIPINYARLIPGHFYTFVSTKQVDSDQVPSMDEYQTGESRGLKPYFDRRPIFLSLGQEGPMEIGLNVKVMPTTYRKWFLQKYLKVFLPVISKLVDEDGDLINLNSRVRLPAMEPFFKINRSFAMAVGEQSGLNFKFLVDKYTRGEMGNPLALIDWDQVPKLSMLTYLNDGSIASKTPISYFLTKFT